MNKNELVDNLAGRLDTSKRAASDVLNSVLDIVAAELKHGGDVSLSGFGKFSVTDRPEREGRNPATGQPMTIKASKQVRFKPMTGLKEFVNGERSHLK